MSSSPERPLSDGTQDGRRKSWRGEPTIEILPPKYRWQSGDVKPQREEIRTQSRSVGRRLFYLLFGTISMLVAFVAVLLHAPIKTPVIMVAPTAYSWPMPPNAWAKEDVANFQNLHGKTIHLHDSSQAWQTKSAALDDLRKQLREFSGMARRSGCAVLYLNMHGLTDEDGRPCLVPPGAAALSTNQWIPLEEITAVIAAEWPKTIQVLIVLDSVEREINWSAAVLHCTFVERAVEWMEKQRIENICLFTSCSAEQKSWSGPDIGGSIFGREFLLGLSGLADQPIPPTPDDAPNANRGGNADGMVSVAELERYLKQRVQVSAQTHRGADQVPRISPSKFADVRVAWTLQPSESHYLDRRIRRAERAATVPSIEDLSGLWRKLDQLRQARVYMENPAAWAELERRLLWLEQLSIAGSAYSDQITKQLLPDLRKALDEAAERTTLSSAGSNYALRNQVLSVEPLFPSKAESLPSLALQELLGGISPSTARSLRIRQLDAANGNGDGSANDPLSANMSAETNFTALLSKHRRSDLWPDGRKFREALELRDRAEQLAVFGDPRGHKWKRNTLAKIDGARRAVEDKLFIGPGPEDDALWSELRNQIAAAGAEDRPWSLVEEALNLRDLGLAEAAYAAAWVCSPDNDMAYLGEWLEHTAAASDTLIASTSSTSGTAGDPARDLMIDSRTRERLAIARVNQFIESVHELGSQLAHLDDHNSEDLNRLQELVRESTDDRDGFALLVKDHVDRLLNRAEPEPRDWRAISALLEMPFLPWDARLNLSQKRMEIERKIAASVKAQSKPVATPRDDALKTMSDLDPAARLGSAAPPDSSLSSPPKYMDRIRDWNTHPLAAILKLKRSISLTPGVNAAGQTGPAAQSDVEIIDRADTIIRNYYLGLAAFKPQQLSQWMQAVAYDDLVAASQEAVEDMDQSSGWWRSAYAAHIERAVLPICPIRAENDTSSRFRKLALKDLILWYASRTLDDFYATASDTAIGGAGNKAFFETAVAELLSFADAISESTPETDLEVAALQRRTTILSPLARHGLKLILNTAPPTAGSDQLQFQLTLRSNFVGASDTRSPFDAFPAGRAAVIVRSNKGLIATPAQSITMPPENETPRGLSVPPIDRSLTHEALVLYRGHEYRAPLFVGSDMLVDFRPAYSDKSSLILFGDRERQPSIMFVLDCSWSMGEQLAIEAVDSRSQSRLDAAKVQLLRLIAQLASRPDARLGVRVFGHRLGWSRPPDGKAVSGANATRILPSPKYRGDIPDDLVPSRDVEAIVPLGRFTSEMIGSLSAALTDIMPWGQSPLYLAIVESFRDLARDDSGATKSIVVITDGDNFQFTAARKPGSASEQPTTKADLLRAWEQSQVPLFILGVGVTADNPPGARESLLELAQQTGGKYYDIENENDLLRALSEQLSTAEYSVKPSDLSTSPVVVDDRNRPAAVKLNSPFNITLDRDADHRIGKDYELTFRSISKRLKLYGGEALELSLTSDGQDIVSKPYDRSSPKAAILSRPGRNDRITARVHRPIRQNSGVLFPVSFQDPDAAVTPRPVETWIEITPRGEKDSKPHAPYIFYDSHYKAGTPVPMQEWYAPDWPEHAIEADIQVWVKFETTVPLLSIPMRQLAADPGKYTSGLRLEGFDGSHLSIHVLPTAASGETSIEVIESHPEGSRGIGSVRVLFDCGPTILPKHVVRRFDRAGGIAVHTLTFSKEDADQLLKSDKAMISVQAREAAHASSFRLPDGQFLRVSVGQASDLLAPGTEVR